MIHRHGSSSCAGHALRESSDVGGTLVGDAMTLKYRCMTAEAQAPPLPSIFRLPGFRTIWIAQFISIFGDFLALFGIISFITFRLHGTAVQVTTITIAYILPLAVFGPVAGVLVDRFDVKR